MEEPPTTQDSYLGRLAPSLQGEDFLNTSTPFLCPTSNSTMEESTSKLMEVIQEPTVVLKDELKTSNQCNPLKKAKPCKRVAWSSDTIDNEHLGRRSSKCCVYEKPRAFGESSSESEKEDDDNGDVLCTRHHKGRCHVLSSAVARISSAKPKDASESLPSLVND
ncbi:hypothetical protein STEG23_014523 [Scotinomys teguina]